MAGKNVTIKFDSDTKDAQSGIDSISKKLASLSNNIKKGPLDTFSKLGSAATGLKSTLGMATQAIKAVGAAISECTDAYKVQATAERQLEVAAKNNPYLNSTNVTNLKNYASELQKISTYGDEELLPMMAQLAASGRTEEQIMQVMGAAIDVAASGTMSLDAAVTSLNKTYSGTAGTLGKTNSKIKELTEEELKNGDAVKIMAEQYKGMAEETAKATGSTEQLKSAWGDFKEHIGSGFEALLAPVRRGITEIISGVNNAISRMKQARLEAQQDEQVMSGNFNGLDSAAIAESNVRLTERANQLSTQRQNYFFQLQSRYNNTPAYATTYGSFSNYLNRLMDEENDSLDSLESAYRDAAKAYNDALKDQQTAVAGMMEAREREQQERAAARKAEIDAEAAAMKDAVKAAEKTLNISRTALGQAAMTDDNMTAEEKETMYNAVLSAMKSGLESSSDSSALEQTAAYKYLADLLVKYRPTAKAPTASTTKKEEKTAQELVDELMATIENVFEEAEKKEALDSTNLFTSLKTPGNEAALQKVVETQLDTAINGLIDIAQKKNLDIQEEVFDGVAGKITQLAGQLTGLAADKKLKERYDKLMADLGDAIGEKSLPLSKELKQRKEDLKKFAEETMQLYEKGSIEYISIEEKTAEALKAIDKDITQAKREEWDERLSIAQDYMTRFTEISNYLVDLTMKANEAESRARLAELEKEYDEGLVSETEFEEKRDQIRKEGAQENYKMQMWQWGVQVAQIGVDTAKAIMSALSSSGNIYAGIAMATLVGAMGAAQLGAAIANKPKAPSFESGGIVPGTSWSGDNVQANVNSGEMVLTRGQQARLWNMLGGGGSSGTKVSINNYLGRNARIQTQSNKNGLTIDVLDSHINKTMADGGYDTGFAGRDVARQGVVLV